MNPIGEEPLATSYVYVKAKDDERACVAAVRWYGDNDEVLKNDQHQWYLENSHRKVRYTALKAVWVSDDELNEFLSFTQGLSKAILVVDIQSAEQEEAERIMSKIRHWQDSVVPLPTAQTFTADTRKFLGTEISHKDWSSLLIYLREPTVAKWTDIQDIKIKSTRTIWQKLIESDTQSPVSSKEFTAENIPLEEKLIEIFRVAVIEHNNHCHSMSMKYQHQYNDHYYEMTVE